MRREDKDRIINSLTETISNSKHFYLADISNLDAEMTAQLRRKCFEKEVKLIVVKNTLLRKALDKCGNNFEGLYGVLNNSTSVMFSETANIPAKLIKEFRKKNDRPILKGAYVEESIFLGDEQLDVLVSLKSKEELIGELIALLQSPAKNVLSALQSGSNNLTGIIKTLSEKQ